MTDQIRQIQFGLSKLQEMNFKSLPDLNKTVEDRAGKPFSKILQESIYKVNDIQKQADVMTQRLALGEVDDVSEVSVAVEKAELALRMMVQIRDKLVDAYQQIARMTV